MTQNHQVSKSDHPTNKSPIITKIGWQRPILTKNDHRGQSNFVTGMSLTCIKQYSFTCSLYDLQHVNFSTEDDLTERINRETRWLT